MRGLRVLLGAAVFGLVGAGAAIEAPASAAPVMVPLMTPAALVVGPASDMTVERMDVQYRRHRPYYRRHARRYYRR